MPRAPDPLVAAAKKLEQANWRLEQVRRQLKREVDLLPGQIESLEELVQALEAQLNPAPRRQRLRVVKGDDDA